MHCSYFVEWENKSWGRNSENTYLNNHKKRESLQTRITNRCTTMKRTIHFMTWGLSNTNKNIIFISPCFYFGLIFLNLCLLLATIIGTSQFVCSAVRTSLSVCPLFGNLYSLQFSLFYNSCHFFLNRTLLCNYILVRYCSFFNSNYSHHLWIYL